MSDDAREEAVRLEVGGGARRPRRSSARGGGRDVPLLEMGDGAGDGSASGSSDVAYDSLSDGDGDGDDDWRRGAGGAVGAAAGAGLVLDADDADEAERRRQRRKRRRRRRERRRRAKRCCWGKLSRCQGWTLGVLVTLGALMAIGILVVGRLVAQDKLNSAHLKFESMHLGNPAAWEHGKPCGSYTGARDNGTLCMRLSAHAEHSVPFTINVDPARVKVLVETAPLAGGLYGGYEPPAGAPAHMEIGELHMPSLRFSSGSVPRVDVQTALQLTNEKLFTAYNLYLVNSTSAVWHASASLDVHVKAWILPITYGGLSYSTGLEVPGFNGVRNVTVDRFDLPGDAPGGDGVLLNSNATLFNPGLVSVDLGESFVDVYFGSVPAPLGRLTVAPVTLRPGLNPLYISGVLSPPQEYADELTPFFSAYLNGGEILVRVRGVGAGPLEPAWMQDLVAGLELELPVTSLMDVDVVRSVGVHDIAVAFSDDAISLSANVTSEFANPFGFPIQVLSASLEARMLDLGGGSEVLGRLQVPDTAVSSRYGDQKFSLHLGRSTLVVDDQRLFDAAVRDVLEMPSVAMRATATANVTFLSAMGRLSVEGVPIRREISVPVSGLNNFEGVQVSNGPFLDAHAVSPTEVSATSTADFTVDGGIDAATGDLSMDLVYGTGREGVVVGRVDVPDGHLRPGHSSVRLSTSLLTDTAARRAAIAEFGTRYVTRQDLSLAVRGRADSSPNPVLAQALNGVELDVDFVPPEYSFVVNATIHAKIPPTASIWAYNPLPVAVALERLTFDVVDLKGRDIYTMETSERVMFQPGLGPLKIDVPIGGFHLQVLRDAFKIIKNGKIPVHLRNGEVSFEVPHGFHQTVGYETPTPIDLAVVWFH